MTIYFYSAREEPYGAFSNFASFGIEMSGQWWPTTEHYFQAQKFAGTEHEQLIQGARTPKEAANMGRDRKRPLRKDWERIKDDVMLQAVLKKFQTHKKLRELLLSTGNEELVEAAPGDYYWGAGQDGSGKNMLGKILMQVREQLQKDEPENTPVAAENIRSGKSKK